MSASLHRAVPVTQHPEEVAELLRPSGPRGLPRPAYGGRSVPNVTRSVADAVGARVDDAPELVPPLDPSVDPFQGRRAEGPVVVLLVDGFGWYPFDRWTGSGAGALASAWGSHARPITTVFPTTTSAALVALSTATPPGRSGVVGYRQFLPAHGVVADLLKMSAVGLPGSDNLVGPHWSPTVVSAAPSVFRRGVPGVALSRDRFEGTGFTRTLYDGAEYVPYATASDQAHELVRLLGRESPPPVVYTYWDELDAVHHLRGPTDDLFEFEADRIAHLVSTVARRLLPARTRSTTLLVLADHGQVPISMAAQIRVDAIPEIAREMARPLAGDRRAAYFAARPGRLTALTEALHRHLPEGSLLLPADEAIEGGLFGPPPHHPELRDRVGDLIAFVPEPAGIIHVPPGQTASGRVIHGAHGGLSPPELVIPLVAGPLSDFGGAPGPWAGGRGQP